MPSSIRRLLPGQQLLFDTLLAKALGPNAKRAPSREAARARYGTLSFHLDPSRLTSLVRDRTPTGFGDTILAHGFCLRTDLHAQSLARDRSGVHHEMRDLVDLRDGYRDGHAYRACLTAIERGHPLTRNGIVLSDRATIDRYFDHYLRVLRSIERDGYRRHEDVRERLIWNDDSRNRHSGEIGVAIAADGAFVRCMAGHHRASLAALLGIPSVPVSLRAAHVNWLRDLAGDDARRAGKVLATWLDARRDAPMS